MFDFPKNPDSVARIVNQSKLDRLWKPKSTWEPAPGKSGALESYIDAVEFEIEEIFSESIKTLDNLIKEERIFFPIAKIP